MIKHIEKIDKNKEVFKKTIIHMGGQPRVLFLIDNEKNYRNKYRLEKPVTDNAVIDELWEQHANGQMRFGLYTLRDTKYTDVIVFDLDNKDTKPNPHVKEQTEELAAYLDSIEIQHDVEISQSGNGVHVFIWLTGVNATVARNFGLMIESKLSFSIDEVNPKQERLTESKPLGNNITIPYHNQSRFVDVENDWNQVEPKFVVYSEDDLIEVAASLGVRIKPNEEETLQAEKLEADGLPLSIARLQKDPKIRDWLELKGKDGQTRTDTIHSFAMSCMRSFISDSDIAQAIRYICDKNGFDKRDEWIDLTIEKAHEHHQEGMLDDDYEQELVQELENIGTPMTIADCAKSKIERLEKGLICYPTGIGILDDKLEGGLKEQSVTVFAFAPNMGKSMLLQQILMHVTGEQGVPSLLIQLEMGEYLTGQRAITAELGITEREAAEALEETSVKVEKHFDKKATPYFLEETHIDRIIAAIIYYATKYGVKVFGIDYFQLIEGHGDGEYQALTAASKALKRVANNHNVSIILMCQIKQDCYQNTEFNLNMIKNTSGIGQDIDVAIFGCHLQKINKYSLTVEGNRFSKPSLDNLFLFQTNKNRLGDWNRTPYFAYFDTARHRFRDTEDGDLI